MSMNPSAKSRPRFFEPLRKRPFRQNENEQETNFEEDLKANYIAQETNFGPTFCTYFKKNDFECRTDACIENTKNENVLTPFREQFTFIPFQKDDIWTRESNLQAFKNKILYDPKNQIGEKPSWENVYVDDRLVCIANDMQNSWEKQFEDVITMSEILTKYHVQTFEWEILRESIANFRRDLKKISADVVGKSVHNVNFYDLFSNMKSAKVTTGQFIDDVNQIFGVSLNTRSNQKNDCLLNFIVCPIIITGDMKYSLFYQTEMISYMTAERKVFEFSENDQDVYLNLSPPDVKSDILFKILYLKNMLNTGSSIVNHVFSSTYDVPFDNGNIKLKLGDDKIKGIVMATFYQGESFTNPQNYSLYRTKFKTNPSLKESIIGIPYLTVTVRELSQHLAQIMATLKKENDQVVYAILNYFNIPFQVSEQGEIFYYPSDAEVARTASRIINILK